MQHLDLWPAQSINLSRNKLGRSETFCTIRTSNLFNKSHLLCDELMFYTNFMQIIDQQVYFRYYSLISKGKYLVQQLFSYRTAGCAGSSAYRRNASRKLRLTNTLSFTLLFYLTDESARRLQLFFLGNKKNEMMSTLGNDKIFFRIEFACALTSFVQLDGCYQKSVLISRKSCS